MVHKLALVQEGRGRRAGRQKAPDRQVAGVTSPGNSRPRPVLTREDQVPASPPPTPASIFGVVEGPLAVTAPAEPHPRAGGGEGLPRPRRDLPPHPPPLPRDCRRCGPFPRGARWGGGAGHQVSGVVGQTRVTTFFFRAGGGQDGETPEAEEEGEEEEAEAQPAELEGESRGGGSPRGGRLGPGMGDRGGCWPFGAHYPCPGGPQPATTDWGAGSCRGAASPSSGAERAAVSRAAPPTAPGSTCLAPLAWALLALRPLPSPLCLCGSESSCPFSGKGDSHGIQGLPSPVGPPLLYLQRPCF